VEEEDCGRGGEEMSWSRDEGEDGRRTEEGKVMKRWSLRDGEDGAAS
jgi:hypothetical protein